MQWYCVDKMYQQKDTQTLAKAFETLFVVRVIRSTFCYDDTLTWKRTHSQAVSCGNNIVMTTEYSWIRTVVLWSHYKMLSSYCFIFHAVWVEAQLGCQTRCPLCISLSFIKLLRDDRPAGSNCTEIFAEITGRLLAWHWQFGSSWCRHSDCLVRTLSALMTVRADKFPESA